jgi:hypothetical protein
MMGGRPEVAEPIARWLVEEGVARPNSNVDARTASVLWRWSQLGDGSTERRRRPLEDALKLRANDPDSTDRISIAAASALYSASWTLQEWSEVKRQARTALILAQAMGPEGEVLAYNARETAIAADFADRARAESLSEMLALFEEVKTKTPHYSPGVTTGPLDQVRDGAYAWALLMRTYFISADNTGNLRGAVIKGSKLAEMPPPSPCDSSCWSRIKTNDGAAPCRVYFPDAVPKTYPHKPGWRLQIGVVYLAIETDSAGSVLSTKVLSAVPADLFPEATIKSVQAAKAARSPLETRSDCTLAGLRPYTFTYQIRRR